MARAALPRWRLGTRAGHLVNFSVYRREHSRSRFKDADRSIKVGRHQIVYITICSRTDVCLVMTTECLDGLAPLLSGSVSQWRPAHFCYVGYWRTRRRALRFSSRVYRACVLLAIYSERAFKVWIYKCLLITLPWALVDAIMCTAAGFLAASVYMNNRQAAVKSF